MLKDGMKLDAQFLRGDMNKNCSVIMMFLDLPARDWFNCTDLENSNCSN